MSHVANPYVRGRSVVGQQNLTVNVVDIRL